MSVIFPVPQKDGIRNLLFFHVPVLYQPKSTRYERCESLATERKAKWEKRTDRRREPGWMTKAPGRKKRDGRMVAVKKCVSAWKKGADSRALLMPDSSGGYRGRSVWGILIQWQWERGCSQLDHVYRLSILDMRWMTLLIGERKSFRLSSEQGYPRMEDIQVQNPLLIVLAHSAFTFALVHNEHDCWIRQHYLYVALSFNRGYDNRNASLSSCSIPLLPLVRHAIRSG